MPHGVDGEPTLTMVRPGAVVGGVFELESVVGSGGMGVVFRARHRETGARVAVKLLRLLTPTAMSRFEREAESLARLRHPAIVGYVGHGVHTDGVPYLAMEWLEGKTLDHVLATGPLSIEDALTVARRIASGLEAAHACGLVHRDVKPGNVVLVDGRFDSATLVDFGLAMDAEAPRVTMTGMLLGTPGFLAPELVRGAPASPASDVFSVGCVLFEMLTGQSAFPGDTPYAVLSRVLLDDPPRPSTVRSDLPPAIDELVQSLVSRRIELRPRDGAELSARLARWELPPEPAMPSNVVRTRRWLPAPSAIVWGALVDSDRWDRITGAPRTRYEDGETTTAEGLRRTRVACADLFGTSMRWVEVGEWVEGAWGWGERRLLEGPFERFGLRFRVEPSGEGTDVEVETYVELRAGTIEGARDLVLDTFRRRMDKYLDALEQLFRRVRLDRASLASAPTVVMSALLLGDDRRDLLVGKPAQWPSASDALEALAEADVPSGARERLAAWLRAATDEQLRFVRPYELASALKLDRREVLRALAHVARRGALEPVLRLACPSCRTTAASADSLAAIAAHARCRVCQVDFRVDLARNVELGLRRPGIELDAWAYCESSPVFRPHVIASLCVPGARTRTEAVPLPAGELRVRRVGGAWTIVELPERCPGAMHVRVDADGVTAKVIPDAPVEGFALVSIENALELAIEVTLERGGDDVDAVRGLEAVTLADLLDVLGVDGLREPLDVSRATVLAIELVHVEALCERVGLVRASELVREALDALTESVRRHGGRVLGEAGALVLACFVDASDARRAASEAGAGIASLHGGALAVRAGIAEGPMIARGGDAGLRFFGGPLTTAPRALAQIEAEEIATTRGVERLSIAV
jgi:class 3 adenylate cyclase